jgi:hypothetical protein
VEKSGGHNEKWIWRDIFKYLVLCMYKNRYVYVIGSTKLKI